MPEKPFQNRSSTPAPQILEYEAASKADLLARFPLARRFLTALRWAALISGCTAFVVLLMLALSAWLSWWPDLPSSAEPLMQHWIVPAAVIVLPASGIVVLIATLLVSRRRGRTEGKRAWVLFGIGAPILTLLMFVAMEWVPDHPDVQSCDLAYMHMHGSIISYCDSHADSYPPDLDTIRAAVTVMRSHHPTLADPEWDKIVYLGAGLKLKGSIDPDTVIAHDVLSKHNGAGIHVLFPYSHDWVPQPGTAPPRRTCPRRARLASIPRRMNARPLVHVLFTNSRRIDPLRVNLLPFDSTQFSRE